MNKAKAEADRKAKIPLVNPPKRVYHYSDQWLQLAVELEDSNNMVIINPRRIHSQSLLEADQLWLQDMARYREELKYHEDASKVPDWMR